MWPYWLLFMLTGLMAISRMRALPSEVSLIDKSSRPLWLLVGMVLTLMIGLRHEVGGDWDNYLPQVEDVAGEAFSDVLTGKNDPAYAALNWLGANVFGGIYLVNTVCAALFSWGLISFCRTQPRPWLALLVAVPYLIIVVAMGYTRQGVAIGLAMLGLTALMKGRVFQFFFAVALAAAFHKSAVILVPLAALSVRKNRLLTIVGVAVFTSLLFFLLLQESVDSLAQNYIEAEYESSGATIRIAMNAVPAAIFMWLRKRFRLPLSQLVFWTWMSLGAFGFVALLLVSPSSTAVDRVALYWIPLQLFVWSRLPDVLGRFGHRNEPWVIAVVSYSAAVQFVWLFFGSYAFAWLPYQFYPWVAMWSG